MNKLKKTRQNTIRVLHGIIANVIRNRQDGLVSVALLGALAGLFVVVKLKHRGVLGPHMPSQNVIGNVIGVAWFWKM